MLFKDIKNGYPVFVLDREEMTATQGKVVNVGAPYFEPQKPGQPVQNINRLVDVTIEVEGKSHTYAIPETLSVTYAGNLAISTEKEGVIREVQAIRTQSQTVVDSYEKHRQAIARCDGILEEWDTAYKEKKENEKRIGNLESKVDKLSEVIADFISELKK